MNLTFPTQAEAQARADQICADLQASNALYAESCALYVSSGGKKGTARWAIPYQDLDKDGKPIDTLWHLAVDDRVVGVLTATEIDAVPELKAQKDAALGLKG